MVEVAYDADPLSVRSPNGEAGTRDTINGTQVRTELVIDATLVTFAK
jgi:hypothetical protein